MSFGYHHKQRLLNPLIYVKGEEKSHVLVCKIKFHLVLSPTNLDSKRSVMFGRHVLLCKSLSPLSHHGLSLSHCPGPKEESLRVFSLGYPSVHQNHRRLHSSVTGGYCFSHFLTVSHTFSQFSHVPFILLLSIESQHLSGLENSSCHLSELGFSKKKK